MCLCPGFDLDQRSRTSPDDPYDIWHIVKAMLYEIFNSVGPVGSIRVCRDSVSRKSLGYGYVNFHSVGDAERGLDTLNYSAIKGRGGLSDSVF